MNRLNGALGPRRQGSLAELARLGGRWGALDGGYRLAQAGELRGAKRRVPGIGADHGFFDRVDVQAPGRGR